MLCNPAICIANIESGKLAWADTQNGTLFKMLDFRRSGHIYNVYTYITTVTVYVMLNCEYFLSVPVLNNVL